MKAYEIAQVCHAANRVLQRLHGDPTIGVSEPWESLDEHTKASCIDGVQAHLNRRGMTPQESHEQWLAFKEATGWTYGPVKDLEAREHPLMVPYDELPPEQKAKDALFGAIVGALAQA